jgi:hypothetical protein
MRHTNDRIRGAEEPRRERSQAKERPGPSPRGGREKRYRTAVEHRGRLRICVSYGSTTFVPVRGGHVGAGALLTARRDTLLVPPRYWYRREFPVGDGCALGRARVAIRSTSWPVMKKRMLQDRNADKRAFLTRVRKSHRR